MTAAEKLDRIYTALRARGEPGSAYKVADLLEVSPSTVLRWEKGVVEPQGKTAERLNLLYRTVIHADKGNRDAIRVLAAILGGTGARLLGLGLGGILIAAGLAWILSGDEEEET